jgi:hypothetical protein
LEAAHIPWHQAGGPALVPDGLARCAWHRQALDRGALGVADDRTVLTSGRLHGAAGSAALFVGFKGERLREPHSPSRRQVFRGPAREGSQTGSPLARRSGRVSFTPHAPSTRRATANPKKASACRTNGT